MTNIYIVRTQSAGCFIGEIAKREGSEVVMVNARRLWSWSGAASLSQLSQDGTSKPSQCRFPCAVPEVTLLGVIEILLCSPEAVGSIAKVQVWEA